MVECQLPKLDAAGSTPVFRSKIRKMLLVKVNSFSYKKSGIPKDETPNGGGFVFDCRFIYNPGREKQFNNLTGRDKVIIDFLDNDIHMQDFLKNVFSIIGPAIDDYISRNFTNLMVSFGCTGGQHRSIYAAEKLREHLKTKFDSKIQLQIKHYEFPDLSSN